MKIACIIPTYNGLADIRRLLTSLCSQEGVFDTYFVDSTSTDGTLEFLKSRVDNLTVVSSNEFNHGGTRQLIVNLCSEYDVCVFLTQDVFLFDPKSINKLTEPFSDSNIAAVCGRQIPHVDANIFARHARFFNYSKRSVVKSMTDVPEFGMRTAFMSNSFAAYRVEALKSIAGFPKHVIFAEDMYVTALMLIKGWKVAYASEAVCQHSHNYNSIEEFSRYFDMGVFHSREHWIQNAFGGASGDGLSYVCSELKYLGLQRFYLWPVSLYRNALKLFGYKLGKLERFMPKFIKKIFGMHKRYWDGPFA